MQFKNYKQNDLFRGDQSSWHLNACVGKNGGPYNFLDYARGYFLASEKLIDNLKHNGNNYIDILIYPICFSFRHGLELYLKYFSEKFPQILRNTQPIRMTHKLTDNWNLIKSNICDIPEFDQDEMERKTLHIEKILLDLVEIDPSGEVFRYPESKDRKRYLQETSVINLLVLGSLLKDLQEVLEFLVNSIDWLLEKRRVEQMGN